MRYGIIILAFFGILLSGRSIAQTASSGYFATINLYEFDDRIIVEVSIYDLYDNAGEEFIETPDQNDRLEEAPFAPQACGKENAAKFYRAAYDDYGLRNGRFITTAVYGDAVEYVTEEGLWQSYNAKGELFDNGKYLVLWRKTKKGWKMFRDSFSSNRKMQ